MEGREEDVEEEEDMQGREEDGVILDLVLVDEEGEFDEDDFNNLEDGGLMEGGVVEDDGEVVQEGGVIQDVEDVEVGRSTPSGQCHTSLIWKNRCR